MNVWELFIIWTVCGVLGMFSFGRGALKAHNFESGWGATETFYISIGLIFSVWPMFVFFKPSVSLPWLGFGLFILAGLGGLICYSLGRIRIYDATISRKTIGPLINQEIIEERVRNIKEEPLGLSIVIIGAVLYLIIYPVGVYIAVG